MSFLIDTNVLSEARRKNGDPTVKAWLGSTSSDAMFLSVLVVGEIRNGIERLRPRDAVQASVFETWLHTLVSDFGDRILPITARIAEEWGRMNAPDRIPAVDGLIAATARVHGLTLVTRNEADFRRTGIAILNPWGG